jgi:hypothetical protein
MECVRSAQGRIPDLLRQAMTESVGEADQAAAAVVADARQRFPEPPPLVPEQRAWEPDELVRRARDPDGRLSEG